MKPGDWVETPHGPARIVEIREWTSWELQQPRKRAIVIVDRGGNRHAWVPSKVKPLP